MCEPMILYPEFFNMKNITSKIRTPQQASTPPQKQRTTDVLGKVNPGSKTQYHTLAAAAWK